MKWAEIPPGLSTNDLFSNSSDADFSDAETLDARHSLELIQLGNNDSTLKEVPKFDGDSGSISDSSEDKEND
ncbi:hypothetical protein OXX69_008780 [Metschnikowia pulcherrima]